MHSVNSSVNTLSCVYVEGLLEGWCPCAKQVYPRSDCCDLHRWKHRSSSWTSGVHSQLTTHSRPLFCLQCFILTAFAPGEWDCRRERNKSSWGIPLLSLGSGVWIKVYWSLLGCHNGQWLTLKGCFKFDPNGSVVHHPSASSCGEWLHFALGSARCEREWMSSSALHSLAVTHCCMQLAEI